MVARTPDEASLKRSTGTGGVYAIVLAAGLSSRMGEPKPLIRLAGRPLLAMVLDAVRHSRAAGIVVVLGAASERVRKEVGLEGARVVTNPEYAAGMSTSIRSGLRAAGSDATAFLFVLGDEPLVTSSTIDALIDRHRATRARIVVPVYRGARGNPVLLHRSLAGEIERITGDTGCRPIVASHADEVVEVPVDDPGILIDIDTPEDVRGVESALAKGAELDALAVDRRGNPRRSAD